MENYYFHAEIVPVLDDGSERWRVKYRLRNLETSTSFESVKDCYDWLAKECERLAVNQCSH